MRCKLRPETQIQLGRRNQLLLRLVFATAVMAGVCTERAAGAQISHAACVALKQEHRGLLEAGLDKDLERGAEWASENMGQLQLQRLKRLFEIEETLAFQCNGVALETAVVIPSLRNVTVSKVAQQKQGLAGGGLRRSTVPVPVKRPKRTVVAVPSVPQNGALEQSNGAKVRPEAVPKPGVSDPAAPPARAEPTEQPSKPGLSTGTKNAKLPNVIRLQEGTDGAKPKSQVRRVKVKKKRSKRTRKSDAYVPPPPNPGYQPSLRIP